MQPGEMDRIASAIGAAVLEWRTLAGGFSHETCLLTLDDGPVVARFGGPDPAIEAAVMAAASRHVPVPHVDLVIPAADGSRPAMLLEYVEGRPLSDVLAGPELGAAESRDLGAVVGRAAAGIGAVTFDRPGFFADGQLSVAAERPWSQQLPEFARTCMDKTPDERVEQHVRAAWADLCAAHAPALTAIDDQARLAHADMNPKNVLVTRVGSSWRVDAVLDWEFSFSGCPYGDAANMARFAADYPPDFIDGFLSAFAEHQPADLPLAGDWLYLGRVLDMFALSDLVSRAVGHQVADRAAEVIKLWVADGVPL
ncbi:MAG TPA: phosphotransferase [Streptosporangiaceae bacterium]|nr:phosphotransferase [Streptosporangiaceae bacterium]